LISKTSNIKPSEVRSAVQLEILALDDQQLVESTNAAVEQYRGLLDHYSRNNRGMFQRLQEEIPATLDDLLNECAVRGLKVNTL
jgi:hypothetical protein